MKAILNTAYAAIAALALSKAFEFTSSKVDYITLVAFSALLALIAQKKEKIRKVAKRIVMPALIASSIFALGWWYVWFYFGFVAPPDYLRPLIERFVVVDGERAYDVKLAEMYWIILTISLALLIFAYRRFAYQGSGHKSGSCAASA